MRWVLEPVTGPDIEPVTLAEMKVHLGEFASVTSRDAEITELIEAARDFVIDYAGCVPVDSAWRLSIGNTAVPTSTRAVTGDSDWAANGIQLPLYPALAITSFVTVDSSGDETAVNAGIYELREPDSRWPRIVGLGSSTWTTGNFRIVFRAGHADRTGSPIQDASVVPARIKQAMKLYAKAHYDSSDEMDRLIKAAKDLLKPLRANLQIA